MLLYVYENTFFCSNIFAGMAAGHDHVSENTLQRKTCAQLNY